MNPSIIVNFLMGKSMVGGGEIVNLEHIRFLRKKGINAQVLFGGLDESEINLFPKDIPVIDGRNVADWQFSENTFFVGSETLNNENYQKLLPLFQITNSKVIYHNQNPFYSDQSFPSSKAINQYPFHAVLVPSEYTQHKLQTLGINKPFYVVYPFIDEQFFPRPKKLQIAYSTRKRADDLQIFNFYYRSLANDFSIPFISLNDLPRAKVAEIMGESAIYLATAKRESLGLMNLEAMASGCHMVGFSGFTDDESIFNANNGDWVKEGEYQLLIKYLLNAIDEFKQNRTNAKITTAYQVIESRFRRIHFEQQAKVAWSKILGVSL